MTYEPQDWRDGPDGGTPISAARLDHIEAGIAATGAPATAPALLPPPRPDVTWKATFQPGHGWTSQLPTGTLTDDPAVKMMGTQSLRLDTDGAAAVAAQRAMPLDLTGRMLALWVRVADLAKVTDLYVYAGNSTMSDAYLWTLTRGADGSPWFRSGEWAFITLPWQPNNVFGSPDPSSITHVRVRLNGAEARAWLNGIGTAPIERDRGVVSITFDDGYASVIEAARRAMTPRGLTGTAYVIPPFIGNASGNFMTEDEVRELHGIHGWGIEAHGPTSYAGMTVEAMRREWTTTKRWIAERGLGRGDHLAYVGGQSTETVVRTAREFFTTARTITGRHPESLPPANPMRLRALSSITGAAGGTSIAAAKAAVDAAAAYGHWLILVFHRIVEGPATGTNDCSWDDFTSLLDHVVMSGVEVSTVDEVVRGL